jgi:hypothetical protein
MRASLARRAAPGGPSGFVRWCSGRFGGFAGGVDGGFSRWHGGRKRDGLLMRGAGFAAACSRVRVGLSRDGAACWTGFSCEALASRRRALGCGWACLAMARRAHAGAGWAFLAMAHSQTAGGSGVRFSRERAALRRRSACSRERDGSSRDGAWPGGECHHRAVGQVLQRAEPVKASSAQTAIRPGRGTRGAAARALRRSAAHDDGWLRRGTSAGGRSSMDSIATAVDTRIARGLCHAFQPPPRVSAWDPRR